MDVYRLLYLKWITYCIGPTVWHRELCSMLCGSLDGRGVWCRMDTCICMPESLPCSPEAITTLLIGYGPIQNLKFQKKRRREGTQPISPGPGKADVPWFPVKSAHSSPPRSESRWRSSRKPRFRSPGSLLTGCVTLSRPLGLSIPQLPPL